MIEINSSKILIILIWFNTSHLKKSFSLTFQPFLFNFIIGVKVVAKCFTDRGQRRPGRRKRRVDEAGRKDKIFKSKSVEVSGVKGQCASLEPAVISCLSFFQLKCAEYCQQSSRFVNATSLNQKTLQASYKVVYKIAQCKKPYTIAEELILH